MREFPLNLSKSIYKGLRDTAESPLNREGLTKLYNAIVRNGYIEPVTVTF